MGSARFLIPSSISGSYMAFRVHKEGAGGGMPSSSSHAIQEVPAIVLATTDMVRDKARDRLEEFAALAAAAAYSGGSVHCDSPVSARVHNRVRILRF